MKRILLISIGVACWFSASGSSASGQATAGTSSATVRYSDGESVTVSDFSEPIGVTPHAIVNVTVWLPAPAPGEHLSVGSLDGGRVISTSGAISNQGNLSFVFQATGNVGLNRVEIRHGIGKVRIQFWVLDTANAQNNPPVITPSHPQG